MKSLIETLADARRRQVGVGHFNFSEPHRVQGDRESAVELKPPVMVSVSESERDFIGVAESAALVKTAHRVAARSRDGFQNHPGKVAPYKILPAESRLSRRQ
jgi:fructose/tagatose bisphosphate aldolase